MMHGCSSWMREHPSVDLSQGTLLCFLHSNKLQHKMHYLATVCQPSCLSIWFSIIPLCLCASLGACACVCVYPQGMARWTLRSSWQYSVPNCCRLTTEKDSSATLSTISSGRWETKLPPPSWQRVRFSSLTLLIIYQFHPWLIFLLTYASPLTVYFTSQSNSYILKHSPHFCREQTAQAHTYFSAKNTHS